LKIYKNNIETPTKTTMNQISERVQEELSEAAGHIRNALSFASRSEKPVTIKHLSVILQAIEDIPNIDRQADLLKQLQDSLINNINKNGESPTI
jgi:hypothetical protein